MDDDSIRSWFAQYMDAFVAEVREPTAERAELLRHYAAPLLLGTDDGMLVAGAEEVGAFIGAQVDGMRAQDYSHTDVLDESISVVNASTALLEVDLVRRAADGSELAHLRVTYLVAASPQGPQIHAMVVHTPST